MPFDLTGRAALVTGASRGIGRATALILASAGCDVTLSGRDGAALVQVAGEIGRRGRTALTMAHDISQPHVAGEIVAATLDRFGRLDILVNNAGTLSAGPIDAIDDEAWQAVLATNVTAVYRFCRAVFAPMRSRHWGGS